MALIKNTLNVSWGEDSRIEVRDLASAVVVKYGMLLTVNANGKFILADDDSTGMLFVAQHDSTNLDAISGYSADGVVAGQIRVTAYPVVADAIVDIPVDLCATGLKINDEVGPAATNKAGTWKAAAAGKPIAGSVRAVSGDVVTVMLYKGTKPSAA